MFQQLINFIYSSTDEQLLAFHRKANAVTGDVSIPSNVTPITAALKKN